MESEKHATCYIFCLEKWEETIYDVKQEKDFLHEELFLGWDQALRGTAGQRKLEGNQEETPLYRISLCQSPTA